MAVEFFSYGYDTVPGEGLGELVWQEMHPAIGRASYAVRSAGDWKVTAVSGADRTVSIAAGRGFGYGVIDKTVANDTIQLDPIVSGSRWDLIATRRDPTPTAGVTSFVKVNGGANPVIPGGRLAGPGIHDQPLALVQVTAGQTQPTGFIDLRTWAGDGGGFIANHELVLSYLNTVGTRINIAGIDWLRRLGANDVPEWVVLGAATSYVPLQVSNYSISGSIDSEVVGTRRRVTVDLNVTRTGPDIVISTVFAGFGPILPTGVRGSAPQKYVPVALSGGGSPGNNNHATAFLNPIDGTMSIRGQAAFTWNTGALYTLNLSYYI